MHGHIDDPDSLILAPRQYDRLYREAADDKHPYAAARLQLRTLIGNHPLLFVGFGLQDEYVMDALATVLEIFGGNPAAQLRAAQDRRRPGAHALGQAQDPGHRVCRLTVLRWSSWLTELARQMSARPADGDDLGAGPAVIPPAYIQWLTEQCADITPFGMAPAQGQSVCLQRGLRPAGHQPRAATTKCNRSASPGNGADAKREQAGPDAGAEAAQPRLVLDLLGERSLYVSGDPGTGKSTFCRWVAWLAATGEMPAFEVAAPDDFQETVARRVARSAAGVGAAA